MILIFLLIACVWLFGQFVSAVAATIVFGIIALCLLVGLLGKLSDSKIANKFFAWSSASKKNTYISIAGFFICCILIGVLYGSSQLSDYDISWKDAVWETTESVMGIEYEETHNGVLVTNNGKKIVTVNIKADWYDKDKNYLDSSNRNWTGPIEPGKSHFIEIDREKDAVYVKYSMLEQKKTNYVAMNAGFESDREVVFELDEDDNDIIVRNNTNHKIDFCGCQYIYYDEAGEIVYVDRVGVQDIPAREKVAKYFKLEKPTEKYVNCEVICYSFYEK